MKPSLETQLPLSYLLIALLTAVVLGAVLLSSLRWDYARQQARYLEQSGRLMAENLSQVIAAQATPESLHRLVDRLNQSSPATVRVLDPQQGLLAGPAEPNAKRTTPPTQPLPLDDRATLEPLPALPPPFTLESEVGDSFLARLFALSSVVVFSLNHPRTGVVLGFVELSSRSNAGAILAGVAAAWGLATLLALSVATAAGVWVSRRITRPISRLSHAAEQMRRGDWSARANVRSPNEIGSLAQDFNRMAEQVESTVQTLRRFVGDAAHGLQTPLTALRSYLELASSESAPSKREEYLCQAQAQMQRLQTLVSDLLRLSKLEHPDTHPAPFDLAQTLRQEVEIYASQAEQSGLRFVLQAPTEPLTIIGQAPQILLATRNLLENALKFTTDGQITVRLEHQGQRVRLVVEDTGPGIPPEDLPHVFERFYQGRGAGIFGGSGLGLAIVQAVAVTHAGWVTAENTPNGARFCLDLPLEPPADATRQALADPS
ncbi:MAG: HAMP domain-containing histidine kinase [Pleurocapsa sp. SU_196_0]|nr:HAMP domain-containing histidine kinase [Pleurocapsa sp. SU_196_0]